MIPESTFRCHLFGTLQIDVDQYTIPLAPQPAALCAFLILNRQRRITREEIQAAFWPDALPARAQERLRRTLYLLRQATQPHPHLIAAEGNELAIAPGASLWVDYEDFERALMSAYRETPPDRRALEQAVALYTDDLLKDIYADWALMEREHANQRFLAALRDLIGACEHETDWAAVTRHAHTMLAYDPLQEAAHRALMRAYAATGDRSAATRQYQQCVKLLEDELGVDPLEDTVQLYQDIRQGRTVAPAPPIRVSALPALAAPDLQWVPLVGREQELADILAEWRICQTGSSRLVLITGPAGMGKTRLVAEAVKRLAAPDVAVIVGNCYAMEAGTPYQLISDLMRHAVGYVTDQLEWITQADLAQLVPTFQTETIREPSPPPTTISSNMGIRLQEAVTHVIRLLASTGGGLWLVTEDLHWADPASLACLNHALRRCADLPLMVIATLRDEEVSFDSPLMDWPTSSVHAPAPTTLIQLNPLPLESLNDLVSQVVENHTGELVPLLHGETAGNPLFVVETLRILVEQGALYQGADNAWYVRAQALPEPTHLPLSDVVLDMIRGRMRRLSRAAQEVLTVASIIEHDINEHLLAALIEPSIALDLALDELLRASVLAETASGVYEFTHIKVREIVYADTSAPRRRYLHRRTAEILECLPHTENLTHISRLAYHYVQADQWTQALSQAWRAAHIAQHTGAMAEANRYAEIAQEIVDVHLDTLDTSLLPESLAAIRFDLLALRAEFRRQAATAGLYYPPDMIEAIEQLVPQLDETRKARASLQSARHLLGQGNLSGANEAAGRGRLLYAGLHDMWGEFDAIQHQIDIAYRAGDMVTAQRLLADMRALSASVDHAETRHALAQNELRLAIYQGHWTAVLDRAQELLKTPSTHTDPVVAWPSITSLGLAYLNLGDYEQAQAVARQAVEASQEANVLGLGAHVLLARLEILRGNRAAARDVLLALLETPDPLIGDFELVSPALALTRCYVADGDTDNAERWARCAGQAMSRIRLPILFPLSQVAWTLTHISAGNYDKARKRLLYPVELLLCLEDTSLQEIFLLRAVASQGLGEEATADQWLEQAWAAVEEQAARIPHPAYRDSFVNGVPLHRFIAYARSTPQWAPQEVLDLHLSGKW